jgi:CheY-like chemotaxis protein/DNA-binding CsgD family transcriptional regulator
MPRHSILIVDDLPENISILRNIIEASSANYLVTEANNGKEALEIVTQTPPDLIITDWDMPQMNGIEFIAAVRSNCELRNIPIIVVTGMMVLPQDLKMAFDSGASDFLRKPFDKTELLARIQSMLLIATYMREMAESKKRELTSAALRLAQMSEMNNKLLEDLNSLLPYMNNHGREIVKGFLDKYKINTIDISWKEFEMRFENVYEEFYKALAAKHSDLTPNEKKLCALLRMGLNSKEIAALTFQDAKSVDMARYRLRKKFELPTNENLPDYLMGF